MIKTPHRQGRARAFTALAFSVCGTLVTAILILSLSAGSVSADTHWQRSMLLADSDYAPGRRNWQDLNQQEKQRIYSRHKQFQGWSVDEQRRACALYYQQTGRIPKACRKFH